MQTQLKSANNMGWVPSGHTSSSLCAWLKMPKMYIKKLFDLITYSLLFFKAYNICHQSRQLCDYNPPKMGRKTAHRVGFSLVYIKCVCAYANGLHAHIVYITLFILWVNFFQIKLLKLVKKSPLNSQGINL